MDGGKKTVRRKKKPKRITYHANEEKDEKEARERPTPDQVISRAAEIREILPKPEEYTGTKLEILRRLETPRDKENRRGYLANRHRIFGRKDRQKRK